MREYDIQAKEFLRRANATITITYIDRRKNTDWGDTFERPFFRVNITTPLGLYGFFFWGAVMDETVSEYDVLSCLEKYDYGSFNNFCNEFGYDNDSIKAYRTYEKCISQYRSLCKIFTTKQMEELREIN